MLAVRPASVRAARPATSGVGRSFALFHLEGVAASTCCRDVRVVDREPCLEALDPVDLGAGEVGRAERIDDDVDAVDGELVVSLGRAPVEAERILEAGAAATLNGDPKH